MTAGLVHITAVANSRSPSAMAFLCSLFAAVMLIFSATAGIAQTKQRIGVVALVNNEPITSLDLENRITFLKAVSNLNISDEDLERDALQSLVSDKLKLQTGKQAFPGALAQVRQPALDIIDTAFARDGIKGREVLKGLNVPLSSVTDKYTADILWSNALRKQFRRQFENIDNLAAQELEKIKKSQSEPQVKLSEIILSVNPKRSFEQTKALADKITEALGKNASFANIAAQYSESPSAQQGGQLNWVLLSRLPDMMQEAVRAAPDNAVIGPLEFDGRIYILRRDGFREFGLRDPKAAKLTLVRAVAPLPAQATDADRKAAAEMLARRSADITSCDEMQTLHRELGSPALSLIENLSVGSLSPQLQKVIMPLADGEKSPVLPFSEGMTIFIICGRTLPDAQLPDIDILKQAEFDRIFSAISSRFLIRLQRKAAIEYR